MFNEIELMRELVLEFGEAITERMRDIDKPLVGSSPALNRRQSSRLSHKDEDSLHDSALKG